MRGRPSKRRGSARGAFSGDDFDRSPVGQRLAGGTRRQLEGAAPERADAARADEAPAYRGLAGAPAAAGSLTAKPGRSRRFSAGGALNLNVHYHTLALDGVFTREASGALRFVPAPPPTPREIARLVATIARRVTTLVRRQGIALAGDDQTDDDAPRSRATTR